MPRLFQKYLQPMAAIPSVALDTLNQVFVQSKCHLAVDYFNGVSRCSVLLHLYRRALYASRGKLACIPSVGIPCTSWPASLLAPFYPERSLSRIKCESKAK
jgi:hypothetical protein